MFSREQLESFISSLDELIKTAEESKRVGVSGADRVLSKALEDRKRYVERLSEMD